MKKLNLFLTAGAFILMPLYLKAFTQELDPTDPLQDYISLGEFNTDGNYDHWDFGNMDNRNVSGGSLNCLNNSSMPHMARVTDQDIVFEPGAVIEARMRFDAGTGNGAIGCYPRIDGSESLMPGINLAGNGTVTTQTDGYYHVYRATLDSNDDPKYFGQLTSMRFNPADGGSIGDNFSIDYIRVANAIQTNNPPAITPPYTDNENNRGLLHCDEATTNLWPDGSANCFQTPDDNSSGRLAVSPILNASNDWEIVIDDSTMPAFKTNSPYGGDYFSFDGNDSIIVTNAWPGGNNLDLDLNFRFEGLPPLSGDNYACLFWTLPVKAYLRNVDDTNGEILMLVYDAAGSAHFFYSVKDIHSNMWYRLSFSASNDVLSLKVGNDTEGYKDATSAATGLLAPSITENVIIGSDYFGPMRLFKGDLDEVRWGVVVPEPFCLSFIIYSLLFIIRKKN